MLSTNSVKEDTAGVEVALTVTRGCTDSTRSVVEVMEVAGVLVSVEVKRVAVEVEVEEGTYSVRVVVVSGPGYCVFGDQLLLSEKRSRERTH